MHAHHARHRNYARRSELEARARFMRHHPTASEHGLWLALSGKRLLGVQFRRQVVIGEYIVDFLAPKLKIVVEVDGGYHENRLRLDARREQRLVRAGYSVVRLPAQLVMRELSGALARIAAVVLTSHL